MLKTETQRVVEIPLSQINPDPNQPRKDFSDVDRLARSMERLGQIHPILITKSEEDEYLIVEGDSRYKAAKSLGWTTMTCIVMEVDDGERRDVQFAANIMRSNLNPFELADEYHRIISKHGLSQAKLAEELEESVSTISATLKLRSLPAEFKKRLAPISRRAGTEALSLVSRTKTSEDMAKLIELIESGATVAELRKTSRALRKTTENTTDEATPEVTNTEADSQSVSSGKAPEEPGEVTATEHDTFSTEEETSDKKVVLTWWKVFSVHAVRAKELLEALPVELNLNTKTLATWIDYHQGQIVGEHRVITVYLAPGKVVHQLIPKELDRLGYQQGIKARCEEYRPKSIRKL